MVGIFLVTFWNCVKVLVWAEGKLKPWKNINLMMLFAASVMFVMASLDVAFHLRHNLDVFIANSGTNAIDQFNNTSNWLNVMAMVTYVVQTFVGDCILIYRCWIVYSRSWIAVLPSVTMWIGTLACGIMTIFYEATIKKNEDLLEANLIVPFITSMLSLTLAMNVLTTSLIIWRIRKIRNRLKHRAAGSMSSPLDAVMKLLVETGLMYTASIVILFLLYITNNNGQYPVSDAVVQIIGITFNLIISRMDRGQVTTPTSYATRSNNNPMPLRSMISVQTSVVRYPDVTTTEGGKLGEDSEEISPTSGHPGPHVKVEWQEA